MSLSLLSAKVSDYTCKLIHVYWLNHMYKSSRKKGIIKIKINMQKIDTAYVNKLAFSHDALKMHKLMDFMWNWRIIARFQIGKTLSLCVL